MQGHVLDGDRNPIDDALVELWQANASGRYRHPLDGRDDLPTRRGLHRFGSAATAFQSGLCVVRHHQARGGPDPRGGMQAPHLNLVVQARAC